MRMLGNVIHECNIRPKFNDVYRETVAARHRAANKPKRQIVLLGKDDVKGGVGGLNKLSSGAAVATHFDSFVVSAIRSCLHDLIRNLLENHQTNWEGI
jgi:hypothetical protein